MNTVMKRVLTSALAVCTAVSAMSFSTSADAAADEFKDLNAAEITDAMGLGWNVGNQLEASSNKVPNETAWQSTKITKELIDSVKEQGFSSVRIPVSYLSFIGSKEDGYKIDEAWLNRVEEVVDYVVENDMYAIINIHGDGYYTVDGGWLLVDEEDQAAINEKFGAVWTQIADKFKDYDEHVVFESMNEVFDNNYDDPTPEQYANINAYNQTFIDAVRATGGNNAKRWVLIPGWNTNIDYTVGDYGFELPDDSKCTADGNRIMVSVHYYDPWDFCGNEGNLVKTQWGKDAEFKKRGGVETGVDNAFQKLYDSFTSKGIPVIIGEMGAIDKSHVDEKNPESRVKWYSYVITKARELGCVPVIWDNGWNGKNGFGLFNRADATVTQPEIVKAAVEAAKTERLPDNNDDNKDDDNKNDDNKNDDNKNDDNKSDDNKSDDNKNDDNKNDADDNKPSEDISSEDAADNTDGSSVASDDVTSTATTSSAAASSNADADKSPATGSNAMAAGAVLLIVAGAAVVRSKNK